jgi:hypothetical protein
MIVDTGLVDNAQNRVDAIASLLAMAVSEVP